MPKVPKVPSVPIPDMDIPFVPKSNKTSYSMEASEINNSTDIYGNDEEAGNKRAKSEAPHDRTWEEKEKEESFELEEDLYSLLYLARTCSMTTFVTVGVFLLQMFILGLIFADLTAEAPVHKEVVFFPLEVPVDIPTTVAVAQFVSLLVATIKEEDIFVSLKALIVVGHDERVSVRFPGATPLKWWIANTLRFLTERNLFERYSSVFFPTPKPAQPNSQTSLPCVALPNPRIV
ncbi:expressed unknown protein [Seminavis robusta]|uniref:Uncharacterized protein n=1 Tax=Seminavis robusta TaxID=568900 RepID=A0A9N8EXM0_9STRA|nr:expressed unknown protein [Seminavis robusta]|eukprot:Sro2086_g313850.1 n/a (233) ;mRNA; r:792-1642